MAEQEVTVKEFVDLLIEKLGIGLSQSQRDYILAADDIRHAQRLAQYYEVPELIINNVSKELGAPTLGTTIRGLREGETLVEPESVVYNEQGQTVVVNPDGSATVVSGTGMTPFEAEQAAQIEAFENLIESLEKGDEDDKNYLLLGGAEYERTRAIVSAPGYRYTYGEGLTAPAIANPIIYESGSEVEKWAAFSPQVRAQYTKAMIDAGMISEEDAEEIGAYGGDEPTPWTPARRTGGRFGSTVTRANAYEGTGALDPSGASRIQIDAFKEALATAGYLGTTPMQAIFARGETLKAHPPDKVGGGGGGGRQAFSVPAALRTIPDYETLQQRVTELMRNVMGRDAEDWEISLLADELQGQHRNYNEKMIEASRAAYERGNRGVGQAIEVPDPIKRTQKFFEETYANEISRRKDIGESANTNKLMIEALTKGGGMVS